MSVEQSQAAFAWAILASKVSCVHLDSQVSVSRIPGGLAGASSRVTQIEHPQRGFSRHEDLLCADACFVVDSEVSLDSFPLLFAGPRILSLILKHQHPSTVLVLAGLSLVNERSI